MTESPDEIIELTSARSNLYKFLSSLYSFKPSEELIDKIKDKTFLSALEDFIGPESFDILEDLEYDELVVEYTRLFVAPGLHYVPPYEAVYKDKRTPKKGSIPEISPRPEKEVAKGSLWGDSTVEVIKKYKTAKIWISEDCKDLPDHIGLELEFMHHLCNKEAEAWKSGNKKDAIRYLGMQREFLREHLATWADKFCEKVIESANLNFYRIAAKITQEYIALDHDYVEDVLGVDKRTLKNKNRAKTTL